MRAAILFLFATAATGAVPPAHAAEPDATPAAGLHFDLGWEDGITYRAAWSDAEGDSGGLRSDVVLSGRVGAKLSLDAGVGQGDPLSPGGWTAAVRRARLYTRGRLEHWLDTSYSVEFGIEDQSFFLNTFSFGWQPSRFVDSVQFGYFSPNLSLGNVAASDSLAFQEVPSPVGAFVPGDRIGLQLAGLLDEPDLSWSVNLSSAGQSQKVGDASNEPLSLGTRWVWRPWREGAPDAPLLHLGANVSYAPPGVGSKIRYRSRPESFLFDYVVDTGDIDADSLLLDLEALLRRGPLSVQGELFASRLHGGDSGDPIFHGGYLESVFSLTGEVRAYDPGKAVLRRLVPSSPFRLDGGGSGALELAGRVSWLDLSDGAVHGGRLLCLSVGSVWTWNAHVRVLAGVVLGTVSGRQDDGFFSLYQTRLELVY